jgi:glycosyltransferase involved in cell wall biosynthesis
MENNYPLISFIIPTYNNRIENIVAIIDQLKIARYEIIVVDDCSDSIISFDGSKRNDLHIIRSSVNNGPGFSRNIGINKASGEYLCFVDDDDTITPNTFHNIESHLSEQPTTDIVLLNFNDNVIEAMSNNLILDDIEKRQNKSTDTKDKYLESILRNRYIPLHCQPYLFKRSFILKNGLSFPETYLIEDQVFMAKSILTSSAISMHREGGYCYNNRTESLKTKDSSSKVCNDVLIGLMDLIGWSTRNNLMRQLETVLLEKNIERIVGVLALRMLILDLKDINLFSEKINKSHNTKILIEYCTNNKGKRCDFIYKLLDKKSDSLRAAYEYLFDGFVITSADIYIYCYGPLGKAINKFLSNDNIKTNAGFIDDNNSLREKHIKTQSSLKINKLDKSLAQQIIKKKATIVVANPQPHVADKIIKKISKFNIESSQIINISKNVVNFADGYCNTL